jgi:hypothetical protein
MVVKLGICIAYDWDLLEYSLPSVYDKVDQICLSIDKDYISWSGQRFNLDWSALQGLVERIDKDKKIFFLKESFYDVKNLPIKNECFQRQRMAEALGKADWIMQLDSDEILINAGCLFNELKKLQGKKRPVNIHGIWINLIKQTSEGFIYSILKTPPLATNVPAYEYGRTNGHFNVYTNTFLAHITWARPEQEVRLKMENWGHSHEFNGKSFFKIWNALDDYNWKYIKDFHHVIQTTIPQLFFHKAKNINQFVQTIESAPYRLKRKEVLSNNIWVSRIKKIFGLQA